MIWEKMMWVERNGVLNFFILFLFCLLWGFGPWKGGSKEETGEDSGAKKVRRGSMGGFRWMRGAGGRRHDHTLHLLGWLVLAGAFFALRVPSLPSLGLPPGFLSLRHNHRDNRSVRSSTTAISDDPLESRCVSMSKARVYADVNVRRPKEHWDYESLSVQWG